MRCVTISSMFQNDHTNERRSHLHATAHTDTYDAGPAGNPVRPDAAVADTIRYRIQDLRHGEKGTNHRHAHHTNIA